MRSQKKMLHLLVAVVLFLGGAALLVFLVDPFFHYHEPWFGLKAVENEKEYQVPGMLKNFEYDSVLAGSSVVMSINTDTLDDRFSCKTVKAVGGSASAPLLDYYLDIAFDSHEIKYVFYGLDVFSFYNNPDMQVLAEDVEFLVNKNLLDDVEYLWNMDVIGETIPQMISTSLDGNYQEGLLYQLNHTGIVGPEPVLEMHCPGAGTVQPMQSVTYQEEYVTENLNRLEKRIKENQETEFLFLIPPYNIVWWDDAYEKGLLDTYLYTLEQCMKRLLPYENVRFYKTDFNEASTITDMYLYIDYIHGSTLVTQQMALQIGTPEDEITQESYKAEIQKLQDVFSSFRTRVEAEGYGFIYEGPITEEVY